MVMEPRGSVKKQLRGTSEAAPGPAAEGAPPSPGCAAQGQGPDWAAVPGDGTAAPSHRPVSHCLHPLEGTWEPQPPGVIALQSGPGRSGEVGLRGREARATHPSGTEMLVGVAHRYVGPNGWMRFQTKRTHRPWVRMKVRGAHSGEPSSTAPTVLDGEEHPEVQHSLRTTAVKST